MLTKITIRNFKMFSEVEIELGERVVLIGPNNCGKTSALQALALWDIGVKRWLEKRGGGKIPSKRPGVTISRQDLISIPVPTANLLWRDLRVRESNRVDDGQSSTRNVLIEIEVEGVDRNEWKCPLHFYYANEESFYCRPPRLSIEANWMEVPEHLKDLQIAYLPPMSGLTAREDRLEMGSIRVRLGEGRTAEVMRNLCWQVLQRPDGEKRWQEICALIEQLFGARLHKPRYIAERGEITMTFSTPSGTTLDISASGRGQQQTLLLLAHMNTNPKAVLLLDEPDAHLEILRQRQIYNVLSEQAENMNSQIIAASHSEVLLSEATGRDVVIAFLGKPHRIDTRSSQVAKALREIGFDQYYLAEQTGWVLYLEGSTDLAILQSLAQHLDHPVKDFLARPFVYYVANQPRKAQEHFHALREAKPDLVGIAIYDQLERELPSDEYLMQHMWRKRELENYLCQRETLLRFASAQGERMIGPLFAPSWKKAMQQAISEVEQALQTLGKNPWSDTIKASEEFFTPLFKRFYEILEIPNLMNKTNFHKLAEHIAADAIDDEIRRVLDKILEVAQSAKPSP